MWHLLVPAAFAVGLTEFVGHFFGAQVLAGYIAGINIILKRVCDTLKRAVWCIL